MDLQHGHINTGQKLLISPVVPAGFEPHFPPLPAEPSEPNVSVSLRRFSVTIADHPAAGPANPRITLYCLHL